MCGSFQLCITVQLPRACGGLAGEALYINTNSNFASHRIRELTKIFLEQYDTLTPKTSITNEFTQDFILQHIHCIPVRGYLELIACIELLETYLKGKQASIIFSQIKLIVIDSISHPMRFLDAEARSTMAARMFRDLRRLAATYNFAVVLTNDLTTRVTKGVSYTTPCFGDSFYHLVNARIVFSKRNNVFCGTVVKSVLHDKKDRVFVI
ncbi:hypothetical protein NQ318_018800 [Aromia moschata]|uniref:DNA repair protein RAD51 homolog 3 n=1 Tax=Aromia moschata TaxID=1265417 RepID=A0AAV8ZG92_9CUCU|nr:hypothetical protein NQ318_018800 [Aromia moschata]